jgi:hypothetical protein
MGLPFMEHFYHWYLYLHCKRGLHLYLHFYAPYLLEEEQKNRRLLKNHCIRGSFFFI